MSDRLTPSATPEREALAAILRAKLARGEISDRQLAQEYYEFAGRLERRIRASLQSESGQTSAAPQASGAKTVSREATPAVAAPYVPSAAAEKNWAPASYVAEHSSAPSSARRTVSEERQGDPQNVNSCVLDPNPTIAELEWLLSAPPGYLTTEADSVGKTRVTLGPKLSAAPAEAVATPDVTDEQLAALRAKYPQDHVATETVLDVLESSAAPADAPTDFIDARIAWIEAAAAKGLPAPSRDELAAFHDGFKSAHSASGFSREDAAKLVERKAKALTDEYCHGDSGPGGYTWSNKEAEWQVILLEELAEEIRRGSN